VDYIYKWLVNPHPDPDPLPGPEPLAELPVVQETDLLRLLSRLHVLLLSK